jgi:hypothetical protein
LRGLISCPSIGGHAAEGDRDLKDGAIDVATADRGLRPTRAYTPAMRRWVCIVALLAGFAGDDYVRGIRLREPVAVERLIETRRRGTRGLVPTGAWWSRPTG